MTPPEPTQLPVTLEMIHRDLQEVKEHVTQCRIEVAANQTLSKLGHQRLEVLETKYHEDVKRRISWTFGVAGTIIATITGTVLMQFF